MKFLLPVVAISLLSHLGLSAEEGEFVPLFDGKTLQGWAAANSTGEGDYGAFSVNEDENAIQIYAGQEAGSHQKSDCLTSDAEFSHYILKLEYKWLEKRFAPRTDWDRDAGLLYHVHGDRKRIWPFCMEMQIGESPGDKPEPRRFHSGDLFVLGNHLRAKTPRTDGFYSADGKMQRGGHLPTKLGVEKPKGEWNAMEIQVHGAEKATFILNGEVVLELFEMEQQGEDGKFTPLAKGRIGLQAEWAELLYRNIEIKELPTK